MATVQLDSLSAARTAIRTSSRARLAKGLPLLLWLGIVSLSLVELWMIALTLDRPAPDQWGFRGFEAVLALSFGSVGALIAMRRPDHLIGWTCLVLSVVMSAQGVVDQYPVLAEAASPAMPFADGARWVAAWIWVIPSLGLMALVPLHFPTGRVPSPRWRLAVVLTFAAMVVLIASIVLAMRPLGPVPPTVNVTPYFERVWLQLAPAYLLYIAAAATAAASLVIRYRRARGDERQQIKWVAYAGVVAALGAPVGMSPIVLGQLFFIGTALFAASAVAIAILRYRLYEIDLIINRTLVYGTLTALLAGVFTASIALSQRLFVAATGEESDAAIVLTTLIVVSLFTPLKTRLQTIVDTRFKPAPPTATAAAAASADGAPPSTRAEAMQLLVQLVQLHQAGALTGREFRAKKAELLRLI